MVIKWRKMQKQVAIKHKTKIHTETREFVVKVGLNSTNKERNKIKSSQKISFSLKLVNGWS